MEEAVKSFISPGLRIPRLSSSSSEFLCKYLFVTYKVGQVSNFIPCCHKRKQYLACRKVLCSLRIFPGHLQKQNAACIQMLLTQMMLVSC